MSPFDILNYVINCGDEYHRRCQIARRDRDTPSTPRSVINATLWTRMAAEGANALHLMNPTGEPPRVADILSAANHLAGYYLTHVNECDARESAHA